MKTKKRVVAEHRHDVRIGKTTHDLHGDEMKLYWKIDGDDGGVSFAFTNRGLKSARLFVVNNGGHIEDNFGNVW